NTTVNNTTNTTVNNTTNTTVNNTTNTTVNLIPKFREDVNKRLSRVKDQVESLSQGTEINIERPVTVQQIPSRPVVRHVVLPTVNLPR
ncbi:MAG: hypothetical protein JW727_00275, partial [Candidatus Aenigmarchaeota archaeon]|nr:hypothetical protein [Candidatus Aenigmarchaeota archaeon]